MKWQKVIPPSFFLFSIREFNNCEKSHLSFMVEIVMIMRPKIWRKKEKKIGAKKEERWGRRKQDSIVCKQKNLEIFLLLLKWKVSFVLRKEITRDSLGAFGGGSCSTISNRLLCAVVFSKLSKFTALFNYFITLNRSSQNKPHQKSIR